MLWAFTHKLKDAFPIVSISFDEVKDKYYSPDLEDVDHDYDKIPERY